MLILRQSGAIWLRIISKPLPTLKTLLKRQTNMQSSGYHDLLQFLLSFLCAFSQVDCMHFHAPCHVFEGTVLWCYQVALANIKVEMVPEKGQEGFTPTN